MEEHWMPLVERGHSGEWIASAGDAEVERPCGLNKRVLLPFQLVFGRIKLAGEPSLGGRELFVLGQSLLQRRQSSIGVRIGPTAVHAAQIMPRRTGYIDALLKVVAEHPIDPLPLKRGLVRVLLVLHIIGRNRDEILANELKDIGASPDKLPGLDSILSAMTTRIAEVKPHHHRLIDALRFQKPLIDRVLPIKALKGKVVLGGSRVAMNLREGGGSQLSRSLDPLPNSQHRNNGEHGFIVVQILDNGPSSRPRNEWRDLLVT